MLQKDLGDFCSFQLQMLWESIQVFKKSYCCIVYGELFWLFKEQRLKFILVNKVIINPFNHILFNFEKFFQFY